MAGYDKDRPFIPPLRRPMPPIPSSSRRALQPPPQTPQRRPTNFRLDNGSTLCSAFLVKGSCPREVCHWDHRKPRPGDKVPLCAYELFNGPCRARNCPLDHTPQPQYAQHPSKKPPPPLPTTPRGNSDPEALSRMERQRNEMYGTSEPPRTSEGGSGVSRKAVPSKPTLPRAMARHMQLPISIASEKTKMAKTAEMTTRGLIEDNDNAQEASPIPEGGHDEPNLLLDEIDEVELKKPVANNSTKPTFIPHQADDMLSDILSGDGSSYGGVPLEASIPPNDSPCRRNVDLSDLLGGSNFESGTLPSNTSMPSSIAACQINDGQSSLLGGDDLGPGKVSRAASTPFSVPPRQSGNDLSDLMGGDKSQFGEHLGGTPKPTDTALSSKTNTLDDLVGSDAAQSETVDEEALRPPQGDDLDDLGNLDDLLGSDGSEDGDIPEETPTLPRTLPQQTYGNVSSLGNGGRSQYGLVPPGIPMRGAAPARRVEMPQAFAFCAIALGPISPERGSPALDGEITNVIDTVKESVHNTDVDQSGLGGNMVGNSEKGAAKELDGKPEDSLDNGLGRKSGNKANPKEARFAPFAKGRAIRPQDLVAQVMLPTRAAQTSATSESPANKGNTSPTKASQNFPRKENFTNTDPSHNSQTLERPAPCSRSTGLQEEASNLLEQGQGTEATKTEAETPLSLNEAMEQTELPSIPSHYRPGPTESVSDSDSQINGGVSLALQGRTSTTVSSIIEASGGTAPTSSNTLETSERTTSQVPQEDDREYEWEIIHKSFPTCTTCYVKGHLNRNCIEKRAMPLAFLQAEAAQDGVEVELLEGNFPIYRRQLVDPIDKPFRDRRDKEAKFASAVSSWLEASSSQAIASSSENELQPTASSRDNFFPLPTSSGSTLVASHATSLAKLTAGHNTPPRETTSEALQKYLDDTPYFDLDVDKTPMTVPYEFQHAIIDDCLRVLEVQHEERLERAEGAKALSHRDGHRPCGVELAEETPKEYTAHKRKAAPPARIVEPTTGWGSKVLEKAMNLSPEQVKIGFSHQINPSPRSPTVTRTSPAEPSSQSQPPPVKSQFSAGPSRTTTNTEVNAPGVVGDIKELDEKSKGYILRSMICFNCWEDGHVLAVCPQQVRPFHLRENIRQAKKIWSFGWAQLLYRKNHEYLLFVPTQYKHQFETWKESLKAQEQAGYNRYLFGSDIPVGEVADNTDRRIDPVVVPRLQTLDCTKPTASAPVPSPTTPNSDSSPVAKRSPYSIFSGVAQSADATAVSVDAQARQPTTSQAIQSKIVVYKGGARDDGYEYKGGAVRHWDNACWNCWRSDLHSIKTCPEQRRYAGARELLRREKMVYSRRWNTHMHEMGLAEMVLPLTEMRSWYQKHHSEPVPESGRSSSPASCNERAPSPHTPPNHFNEAESSVPIISERNPCWSCRGVHEQFHCPNDIPGLRNGHPEREKHVLRSKGKERARPAPVLADPESPALGYESSSSDGSYNRSDDRYYDRSYDEEQIAALHSSLEFALGPDSKQKKRSRHRIAKFEFPDDPLDTWPASHYKSRAASKKYAKRKGSAQQITGKSYFAELPTEILDQIFELVWFVGLRDDGYLGDSTLDQAMAKRIQCREYAGLLRVSKRCCAIAQRLIYSSMTIVDRHAMIRFMKVLMQDKAPQLREYVQHINFAIEPIANSQAYFSFKPRLRERLDELESKDFNGPEVDENYMYHRSLRIVAFLMKHCPNLQTLFAQFRGSIQSFDKIQGGHYPQLRELTLNDKDCTAVSLKSLWKVAALSCPNLEKLALEYSRNNRHVDFKPLSIRSSLASYRSEYYRNMKSISFKFAPEISDEWLVIFAKRMPKLQSIYLEDCKNVSADGVAKCIKHLSQPLLELTYIPFMDWIGRVFESEAHSGKSAHLCEALAAHCETLQLVKIQPYRVCKCLFEDKKWVNIESFSIDMFQYRGCFDADGQEMALKTVQDAITTSQVPTRALKNFIVQISGAAVVRTRRAGDADLPPIPANSYY